MVDSAVGQTVDSVDAVGVHGTCPIQYTLAKRSATFSFAVRFYFCKVLDFTAYNGTSDGTKNAVFTHLVTSIESSSTTCQCSHQATISFLLALGICGFINLLALILLLLLAVVIPLTIEMCLVSAVDAMICRNGLLLSWLSSAVLSTILRRILAAE